MQITGIIANALPRQVNRKDGSGSFTMYDVQLSDGQKWVARKDIYDYALTLIGQQVSMECRVEQNGNYTNKYVDVVTPLGAPVTANAALEQIAGGPITQAAQEAYAAYQSALAAQANHVPPLYQPTPEDHRIWRQVAAKVAGNMCKDWYEFWSVVDRLEHYFETGEKSFAHLQAPDPAAVQFAQNVVAQSAPTTDDDIPF